MSEWLRLPISVYNTTEYPGLSHDEVPKEGMYLAFVDVRKDSIVGVRPYFSITGDQDRPDGTIIYTTSGQDHVIEIMPSTMRKLIGYEPIKVEAETFNK